jgi:hypothetical protein
MTTAVYDPVYDEGTKLWVYDLRTNQHFTLKQNPLRRHHLDEFVDFYLSGKSHDERVESERWKSFAYEELIERDKVSLDITWLRDNSLEDADNLPAPEIIAREIVEDLTAVRDRRTRTSVATVADVVAGCMIAAVSASTCWSSDWTVREWVRQGQI